jgi:hypothetical protein
MRRKALPPVLGSFYKSSYKPSQPGLTFEHNDGSVTVSSNDISVDGKMEDAAWALADECLRRGKNNNNTNWRYFSVLEVTLREGMYDLTLLNDKALDAPTWELLKKNVERICNHLKAFM